MKLVVVIPALNEQATIGEVVARIPAVIPGVDETEILVVDDGSTDATAEYARAAGAAVVSHQRNEGVGAAFASGVAAALQRGADLVVNMDGDGQFRPEDIPALIRPILEDHAGFVTCSRFRDPRLRPEMPAVKFWGNQWMTWLIGRICGTRQLTDVSCGFRAYTRDTLLRLSLYGRYTYTQETFINLAAHHVRMAEVALPVRGTRAHGDSRVAGSIFKYIAKTVPIIFRTMRDVRPFAFFGTIAGVVLLVGVLSGGFVFVHWLATGRTHPYQSVITASGVVIVLGFLLLVVALLADMLNRLRRLLEELIYLTRRQHYDRASWRSDDAVDVRALSRRPADPPDAGPAMGADGASPLRAELPAGAVGAGPGRRGESSNAAVARERTGASELQP
ncbi:MAG: glycosyltransferase family 2 protein [Planctomycetota bacterium]